MKKAYEAAEVKVTVYNSADIIAVSPGNREGLGENEGERDDDF